MRQNQKKSIYDSIYRKQTIHYLLETFQAIQLKSTLSADSS
jgi:hypothetical protein